MPPLKDDQRDAGLSECCRAKEPAVSPSIVVIGATPLGRRAAQTFAAANITVALSDRDPHALDGLNAWAVRADVAKVLRDDSVSGVALTGPVAERAALAEAALTAGKQVLVLGALTDDPAQAAALQAYAAQQGQTLLVAQPERHRPAVQAALDAVPGLGALQHAFVDQFGFGAGHSVGLEVLAELLGTVESVQVVGAITHVQGALRGFVHTLTAHPSTQQRLTVIGQAGALVLEGDQLTVSPAFGPSSTQALPGDGLAVICAAWLAQAALPGVDATALRAAAARSQSSGKAVALQAKPWFAHETVEIDGAVQIGEGTRIWHFSKLLGPLTIGKGCSLGQNVVVERGVTLGDNVKVQNNVSIYSGVILEDDVFCGPSMVFTNVGTPRSHYPRRGEYLITRCKQGASIGANATIVCGNTLGRYCFIGAGAVVTKDVPDFALVYGNPARVRAWACYCGATLPLIVDTHGVEEATCAQCTRRYVRQGHEVRWVEAN
jgi:UDP-2-acetamido-3-amino-2,3-dideoxy-glucuronate N-acetyltransferase